MWFNISFRKSHWIIAGCGSSEGCTGREQGRPRQVLLLREQISIVSTLVRREIQRNQGLQNRRWARDRHFPKPKVHPIRQHFNAIVFAWFAAPVLPDSCMPLGMKAEDNRTKVVSIDVGPNLLHHTLSVSFANGEDDDIISSNIAGFVCVYVSRNLALLLLRERLRQELLLCRTGIDMDRQMLTVLAPQPRPLPKSILLLSDVHFMDSH